MTANSRCTRAQVAIAHAVSLPIGRTAPCGDAFQRQGGKTVIVVTQRPRRWMHPGVKLLLGVVVAAAAAWLVVSTAGGLGDAVAAVGRMRLVFVAVAVVFAVLRLALFGLQFLWLGRRTDRRPVGTAMGLSLVVYGFGAVTPAAPVEGLAIASGELRRRGRSKHEARMICSLSGFRSAHSVGSQRSTCFWWWCWVTWLCRSRGRL